MNFYHKSSAASSSCTILTLKSRNSNQSQIIWRDVGRKGRGLIANCHFRFGDVISTAPAIGLNFAPTDELRPYVFLTGRSHQSDLPRDVPPHAMVFGPMALCNHCDEANARVNFYYDPIGGLFVRLVALRNIRKGQEITIQYADTSWYEEQKLF